MEGMGAICTASYPPAGMRCILSTLIETRSSNSNTNRVDWFEDGTELNPTISARIRFVRGNWYKTSSNLKGFNPKRYHSLIFFKRFVQHPPIGKRNRSKLNLISAVRIGRKAYYPSRLNNARWLPLLTPACCGDLINHQSRRRASRTNEIPKASFRRTYPVLFFFYSGDEARALLKAYSSDVGRIG